MLRFAQHDNESSIARFSTLSTKMCSHAESKEVVVPHLHNSESFRRHSREGGNPG